MRRGIASLWHASSLVLAGVLFFLFVIPRWFELTGQWPGTLGTVLRIVCGVLVGLTALPVVLTLARTRKPELGTPALALSLRVWSIIGHVAAGVLITGAAISEIWLDLDTAGQWLFGIYGAAAAIALLAAFAFYLAFVAELPPPPPKPLKVKA
ncbi:MAG: rane protein, partial [Mycobacterium sp.]|nr:rane protein [Mycobacterium sp.]